MLGHLEEPPQTYRRVAEYSILQREAEAVAQALVAEKAARRDESAAAAAEMAELTARLSAAEAMRFSDMSDISWPDISETEKEKEKPDLEQGEARFPLAGHTTLVRGARRWSEELTLSQPWRSHTLKGLSKECISHWTESNEAEFRDGMYHSGFKWRVFMMSSLAFSVLLMVLVDPCLTMLGALTCPFQLLLLSSQITAQRMVDRRRGRQLGQRSLILICIGYACFNVPIAQHSSSGEMRTWKGDTCTYEDVATTHPFHVLNLFVGPATLFVGVMMTFMTISTKCFVALVTGFLLPVSTAYFLRDAVNLTFKPIPTPNPDTDYTLTVALILTFQSR